MPFEPRPGRHKFPNIVDRMQAKSEAAARRMGSKLRSNPLAFILLRRKPREFVLSVLELEAPVGYCQSGPAFR